MLRDWLAENVKIRSQFAASLGVSPGYLSDLANGNKKPSLEIAMRIQLLTSGSITLDSWFTDEEMADLRKSLKANPEAASGKTPLALKEAS